MTDKLFDALETCLHALDNGETLDSALQRFPALAEELRPILEASLHAKSLAGEAVADSVHRRGRARVLQHAAQMREAKRAPRQRTWIFALRPLAVTLMLIVFLLSGTGLVRASSTALPGDNLYPVKRTWEGFTLIFAADMEREDLELAYETERVEEINELLAEGRTETVSFSGYVNQQQPNGQWNVAGVPVLISGNTLLPGEIIQPGAAVTISGRTNADGFLVADSVTALPPGAIVPALDDDEDEDQPGQEEEDDESEGDESSTDGPSGEGQAPGGENVNFTSKLEGVLQSVNGNNWLVNGLNVDVSGAQVSGVPVPGANVIIEGYYNTDGVFIATRIVFIGGAGTDPGTPGGDNASGSNDSGDDNDSNDDDNNDNEDNDNEDNDNGDEDDNDNNDND